MQQHNSKEINMVEIQPYQKQSKEIDELNIKIAIQKNNFKNLLNEAKSKFAIQKQTKEFLSNETSLFDLSVNGTISDKFQRLTCLRQERFGLFFLERTHYELTTSSDENHLIFPILMHYIDQYMSSYLTNEEQLDGFQRFLSFIFQCVEIEYGQVVKNEKSRIFTHQFVEIDKIINFCDIIDIILSKNQFQFGFSMKIGNCKPFWTFLMAIVKEFYPKIMIKIEMNEFLLEFNIPIQLHYLDCGLIKPGAKNKQVLLLFKNQQSTRTKYSNCQSEFMIVRQIKSQQEVKINASQREIETQEFQYYDQVDVFSEVKNSNQFFQIVPWLPIKDTFKDLQNIREDYQVIKFSSVFDAILMSYFINIIEKNERLYNLIKENMSKNQVEYQDFFNLNRENNSIFESESLIDIKIPVDPTEFRQFKYPFLFYLSKKSIFTIDSVISYFLSKGTKFHQEFSKIKENPSYQSIESFQKFVSDTIDDLNNSFRIWSATDQLDPSQGHILYFKNLNKEEDLIYLIIKTPTQFPTKMIEHKFRANGIPKNSLFYIKELELINNLINKFTFNFPLQKVQQSTELWHLKRKDKNLENMIEQFNIFIEFSSLSQSLFFVILNLFYRNEIVETCLSTPSPYQIEFISKVTQLPKELIQQLYIKFEDNIKILKKSKEGKYNNLLLVFVFEFLVKFQNQYSNQLQSIYDFDKLIPLENQIKCINSLEKVASFCTHNPNVDITNAKAIIEIYQLPNQDRFKYRVYFKNEAVTEGSKIVKGVYLNFTNQQFELTLKEPIIQIHHNIISFESKKSFEKSGGTESSNCGVCKINQIEVFDDQHLLCSECFNDLLYS